MLDADGDEDISEEEITSGLEAGSDEPVIVEEGEIKTASSHYTLPAQVLLPLRHHPLRHQVPALILRMQQGIMVKPTMMKAMTMESDK